MSSPLTGVVYYLTLFAIAWLASWVLRRHYESRTVPASRIQAGFALTEAERERRWKLLKFFRRDK